MAKTPGFAFDPFLTVPDTKIVWPGSKPSVTQLPVERVIVSGLASAKTSCGLSDILLDAFSSLVLPNVDTSTTSSPLILFASIAVMGRPRSLLEVSSSQFSPPSWDFNSPIARPPSPWALNWPVPA